MSPIAISISQLLLLWRHLIMMSFASLAPTALAAPPFLVMTSFSSWRRSLLSWPRPALRTYVANTLPRLIYKNVYLLTFQGLIYLSFNQLPIIVAHILPSTSGASVLGKKVRSNRHTSFLCNELTMWRVVVPAPAGNPNTNQTASVPHFSTTSD